MRETLTGALNPPMIAPAEPAGRTALLTKSEAREITDRIRATAEDLCGLLTRAHDGKAYEALGYATWNEYVAAELDISRSRAFQLLREGRVRAVLADAAGSECNALHSAVSGRAAREIEPQLEQVVSSVREKVSEGVEPSAAVREAVEEARQSQNQPEPYPDEQWEADLATALEAALVREQSLSEEVEHLRATDAGKERQRYAQLEGRVRLLMEEVKELRSRLSNCNKLLERIRGELRVDGNSEIIEAIHDLMR